MSRNLQDDSSNGVGFHTGSDGFLYCDDVKMSELHRQLMTSSNELPTSPVFVYSRRQLERNVKQYQEAVKTLPVPAQLNFSMKANSNLHILKLLRSLGCGVTLVSGTELLVALEAGFEPRHMLLNGSGKAAWEIAAAVKRDILVNVDSEFDLRRIIDVCRQQGDATKCRVLLRVNLDIDPEVHQYVSTGKSDSKFGLDPKALSRVVHVLTSEHCPIVVEGLHCHLGSTIKDVGVYRESLRRLLELRQDLMSRGLRGLRVVNIGGGLAIDYELHRKESQPHRMESRDVQQGLRRLADLLQQEGLAEDDRQRQELFQKSYATVESYIKERIPRAVLDSRLKDLFRQLDIGDRMTSRFPAIWSPKTAIPTATHLVQSLVGLLGTLQHNDDVSLILEPGRSLVGNAGILLTTVLGCKSAGCTNYLVVDGAMNDVIRPSLYGAYHHIYPADPVTSTDRPLGSATSDPYTDAADWSADDQGPFCLVDVVGPVCESGDFLGRNRLLPVLSPGACVVLYDAGAYCAAMASNYNLRLRAAEVMVDGAQWRWVRRPDTLQDVLATYDTAGMRA